MKILITTDWYEPVINGVVTSVVNLRKGLEEMGHEVRILTLSNTVHSYEKDRVIYVGSLNVGRIYPNARMQTVLSRRWFQEILKWKPDIVHSQCEFSTFFFAGKIAKACGCPLVHTYHTVYEDFTHYFSPSVRLGKTAAALFSKKLLNRTEAVIVPTEKIRQMLKGYGVETSVAVIPSGLELRRFQVVQSPQERQLNRQKLGLQAEDFVLVYLGRLAKEKNIAELLELLSQQRDPRIKLLLVGDGPCRGQLEKEVERLALTDRVIFAGMAEPQQVPARYAMGDVFVSASQSETQGLTYIEAMAAGLPVLCREDACLREVVAQGENGFTYSTEQEFDNCLQRLIRDGELRASMGAAAAFTADQSYSRERFAEKVFAEYQKVLSIKKIQTA